MRCHSSATEQFNHRLTLRDVGVIAALFTFVTGSIVKTDCFIAGEKTWRGSMRRHGSSTDGINRRLTQRNVGVIAALLSFVAGGAGGVALVMATVGEICPIVPPRDVWAEAVVLRCCSAKESLRL